MVKITCARVNVPLRRAANGDENATLRGYNLGASCTIRYRRCGHLGMNSNELNTLFRFAGPFPPGRVCLVGAGPGDPLLISVKGALRLTQADVVLYDRLAHESLLTLCQPEARFVHVGKRGGAHTVTQDRINRMLSEHARGRRRVVRLKGGDPFTFGRGGEECEFLAASSIEFEVVPGITAAAGAAAYAGIPLTHRDWSNSLALVSGYAGPTPSGVEWDPAAVARARTVAIYMGVSEMARNCDRLKDAGMPPDTPVAVVARATLPDQHVVTGTLDDIARRTARHKIVPPALVLIGPVVSLRDRLNWFERGPLAGRTVLVTDAHHEAGPLVSCLVNAGADILLAPMAEFHPRSDNSDLDRALRHLSDFDCVLLVGGFAVETMVRRIRSLGLDGRVLAGMRIAAVGEAANQRLTDHFLNPDCVAPEPDGEAVAKIIKQAGLLGRTCLILRAQGDAPGLPAALERCGVECQDLAIGRTVPAEKIPEPAARALRQRRLLWATFCDPAAFDRFATLLDGADADLMAQLRLASAGPDTARAIQRRGLTVHAQADPPGVPGLLRAILAYESSVAGN